MIEFNIKAKNNRPPKDRIPVEGNLLYNVYLKQYKIGDVLAGVWVFKKDEHGYCIEEIT